MPVDHIRYDMLAQEALRGVVRRVLTDAAKKGLPGEHHFFITFDTRAPGVRLSVRMREQYPDEMTIVLQHQFWDLKVTEAHFEVGLSFGGIPEMLLVPYESIKSFFDPSIQFGLQFETLADEPAEPAGKPERRDDKAKPRSAARHETRAQPAEAPAAVPEPAAKPAAAATKSAVPRAGAAPKADAPKPAAAPAAEAAPASNAPAAKADADGKGAEVVQLDRFRKK